ncbi:MAG TPA: SMP-30/gluconolactonase/LRE family protein [Chloroflexota bacterium]|nr:SMP-30/gluconolactonase/LRE family protein [Chloroflexota bacterium]
MSNGKSLRPFAPAFQEILALDARVERIATGFLFTEGPIWHDAGQYLLFSDLAGDVVRRWDERRGVTEFRRPSGKANGLAYDRQERLIACEHVGRRVTRTEADGSISVLASTYAGKPLNSPNDVVVKSDGAIYFSDPPYGLQEFFGIARPQDLDFQGIYRISAAGELSLLAADFAAPNGLAFSPDESRLYVDDTERSQVRVFDVRSDGMLENSRVFFDFAPLAAKESLAGAPDGMKVDSRGNLFCAGPGGIWVLTPEADPLGLIPVPEGSSNLNWGGADRSTLFITATTSLYRLQTKVRGNRLG